MTSLRGVAIRLAVFTVVTLVMTVGLGNVIGNFRLFSDDYAIAAEFEDVSGLIEGDLVKAAGVTVGRVSTIEIVGGKAVVEMTIDRQAQIPAGVGAEIRFRNLIGQRMISFTQTEGSSSARLKDGAVIPLERTEGAFDLSILFDGLRPLIRSTDPVAINAVSRALVQALDGRSRNVEGLLSNVSEIADLVADKDTEIQSLLTNVNTVSSDLASRDGQLQSTLGDLNVFIGKIHADKDQLSEAVINLDRAARVLDRVVNDNEENIRADLDGLEELLDAIDSRRADLRGAIRALPDMLRASERVTSYGEWSMVHLVHLCKDDMGTCGGKWVP